MVKDVEEDLKEWMEEHKFNEDHLEHLHKESKSKKAFVLFLGIFILVTFLVYTVAGGWMSNIFAGMIDSSILEGNSLKIKQGLQVRFEDKPLERLNIIYTNNKGLEFKVCLQGKKQGNVYWITKVIEPVMYEQTATSVKAAPCPKDSVVSLHSHPKKHCLPSDVDIKNFEQFKKKNKDALMAVMCEEKRFTFYV